MNTAAKKVYQNMASQANETRGTVNNKGATISSLARRLYAKHSGNMQLAPTVVKSGGMPGAMPVGKHPLADKTKGVAPDPRFSGPQQSVKIGRVVTKGAVPVKVPKYVPGNQRAHNKHTEPGAIKPVGTDAAMRAAQSTTNTAALHKVGSNQLGDKNGASNEQALRLKAMYPSSHTDTSRKL